jgi:hypothetical protein
MSGKPAHALFAVTFIATAATSCVGRVPSRGELNKPDESMTVSPVACAASANDSTLTNRLLAALQDPSVATSRASQLRVLLPKATTFEMLEARVCSVLVADVLASPQYTAFLDTLVPLIIPFNDAVEFGSTAAGRAYRRRTI